MSREVDQRVVQMQFDNAQFERGAQQSLNTMERLKKAINFDGAAKGLDEVGEAGKRLNFDPIASGVETIASRFSALGIIGVTALQNITNAAVNMGKHLLASFTVDPLKQGFGEYELKMGSVQTIMASTGESIEVVNGYLDELNRYADKTIYSFSDMTSNIGKFTNAGVKLEDAVLAIQGISNEAAVSGANAQEASRAMYNFSQALSSGYVKLIDWKSIENANMATVEFKQQLIETAVAMGTLKKEGDQYISTTKDMNGKVSAAFTATSNFNDSLSAQWMTSEVLVQTLGNYATDIREMSEAEKAAYEEKLKTVGYTEEQIKQIEELGQKAFDSAQDVKTFSQLMDTLKEAVGSGWAQTFELLFGNLEEAKVLWTSVSKAVGGFVDRISNARNEMLSSWKDLGGRADAIEGIKNIFAALAAIIKPVAEAFRNIFPRTTGKQLADITKRFRDFTETLKISENTATAIRVIFTGLFGAIRAGMTVIGGALSVIAKVVGFFIRGAAAILDFVGAEMKLIGQSKAANDILEKIRSMAEKVKAAFKGIRSIDLHLPKFDVEGGSSFSGLLSKLSSALGSGFIAVLNKAGEAFGFIADKVKKFTSAISAPDLMKALTSGILGVGFANLLMSFSDMLGGSSLMGAAEGLVDKIKGIFDGIGGAVSAFEKKTNAETLKTIAISIGILAASCVALASVDSNKLAGATAAIAGLAAELMGTMKVFSGMDALDKAQSKSMRKMAVMMIEISVAILILASAVKKLGSMDLASLGKGLIGVAASMGILVAASKLMSKNSANLTKTAFSMIIFATSLRVMANAVEAFSKIKATSMIKGLIGVGIAMAEMAGFAKLLNGAKINVGTGAAMIAIAAAMLIMAKAVEAFSKMDWESLGKGGAALAGILAVVAGFSQIAGGGGKMIGLGVSLIAISASLLIFADAMKKIAELDWGQLARAGSAIVVFMAAVAGMSQLAAGGGILIAMGIALIGVSTAMLIFASAVSKLGEMDWGQLAKAGAAVVVFMGAVTAMSRFSAGSGKLLAMGASIMLIAGALLVLSTAMKSLGSMSWEQLGKGLLGLVAVFAIIGTAGALLAPIAVPIAVIAAAMLALGAAVFLLTGALLALNGASAMIGVALAALGEGIANALVSFVTALAAAGTQMLPAIVTLITTLCAALTMAVPQIIQTVVVLIESALAAIVELTPVIVQAGMDILIAFLQGIADNIDQVVDQAINIVVNFIEAVAERIPDVIQSGVDLFLGFIEGIAQALNDPNNQARLSAAISGLIMGVLNTGIAVISGFLNPFKTVGQKIMNSGLVQGIKNKIGQVKTKIKEGLQKAWDGIQEFPGKFLQFGKDLVQGIINGIGQLAQSLWNSVKNLVSGALNSGKEEADSSSPSKETTKQGIWMGQGYIIGIKKMAPAVANAMSDMVHGGLETAANAMSKMDDSYSYTPQITPVVDMSNVSSSIGDIGNLFADTSATDLTANISGEMDANKAVLDYISNLDKANSRRNNDVVSALRDLQRDFQNLGDRIDNIEMVMDSGEVVGALTGKMDRALGRQVSRMNRGI